MQPNELPASLARSMHALGSIQPDYAIALAQICVAWNEFEHYLVLAYTGIMKIPYEASKHALHNIPNTNSRANVVRSACLEHPPSEEYKADMTKLLKSVRGLASRRARFVHGRWCLRGDGKSFLIKPSAAKSDQDSRRPIAIRELTDLVADIQKSRKELARLIDLTRPLPLPHK